MHDYSSPHPIGLRFADFADRVGESFAGASASGEAIELLLIRATERPPDPHVAPGFALEFRIHPDDGPRPQQLFSLRHPEAGLHSIFLVPVEVDEQGTIYEAVFSFLPDQTT